ncbi:hypothetical protein MBANPS3_004155 [Mucor bainieri]
MSNNVILIEDSDSEHDAPSPPPSSSQSQSQSQQPQQPQQQESDASSSAAVKRLAHAASKRLQKQKQKHRQTPTPDRTARSTLSAFELQRKRHEYATHPIARNSSDAKASSSARKGRGRSNETPRRIPIDRQSIRIAKRRSRRASTSQQHQRAFSPSGTQILNKHRKWILKARKQEDYRKRQGLPPSKLKIPALSDPESDHREFYVNMIIAQKIEEDIQNGYVERVDYQHVVQLDDLDPELLTGRPLTDTERYWVQKKQARRAGPRSSSWPSNVPFHNQHTEYIRMTEKAENRRDPNARECVECGSKLWGIRLINSLSRPATSRPSAEVVDPEDPLCTGCAKLFSCVKTRYEKMNLIEWLVAGKDVHPGESRSDDSLMNVCRRRVRSMKDRAHEHYSTLPENFVTPEELFEKVKFDNFNCFLAGAPMCLEYGFFNSITFDHISPISTAMMMPRCWSIKNLQPMSHCLNLVKGNESDKEVKRWLRNFKAHYHSPNFQA